MSAAYCVSHSLWRLPSRCGKERVRRKYEYATRLGVYCDGTRKEELQSHHLLRLHLDVPNDNEVSINLIVVENGRITLGIFCFPTMSSNRSLLHNCIFRIWRTCRWRSGRTLTFIIKPVGCSSDVQDCKFTKGVAEIISFQPSIWHGLATGVIDSSPQQTLHEIKFSQSRTLYPVYSCTRLRLRLVYHHKKIRPAAGPAANPQYPDKPLPFLT